MQKNDQKKVDKKSLLETYMKNSFMKTLNSH